MKKMGELGSFICADGKFFVACGSDVSSKLIYRQIELYLPADTGTLGEPIVDTMNRYLLELRNEDRSYRWAIGSTGGLLTARYQIRESDGELLSVLALSGGMKLV